MPWDAATAWHCVGIPFSPQAGSPCPRGLSHAMPGCATQVLVGHPDYEVTGGAVEYKGQALLDLEPDERSHKGLFMRCVGV